MRRSIRKRILMGLGDRNIVLLGMMGCGKSAIGKMLAGKLGLVFKDADQEIEEAADRSVADIFAEYGEDEFRRLENRVIERVLGEGPLVLALGGGAFMSEDTRGTIKNAALSIWLKADVDVLVERVKRKPGKRPLLAKGDPKQIIKELLAKRQPVYQLADIHVESIGGMKSEMRDAVMTGLDTYLANEKTGASA